MLESEALIIIGMMIKVHDECSHCARNMLLEFIEHFPDFKNLAEKSYRDVYCGELIKESL